MPCFEIFKYCAGRLPVVFGLGVAALNAPPAVPPTDLEPRPPDYKLVELLAFLWRVSTGS